MLNFYAQQGVELPLMDLIHVWHEWTYDSKMLQKGSAISGWAILSGGKSYVGFAMQRLSYDKNAWKIRDGVTKREKNKLREKKEKSKVEDR